MNTAIGIQNDATLPNEEQQPPTDNSNSQTNNNNEEDAEQQQERDGSIEIISDPLTGLINVADSTITAESMNSMADTNENKLLGNEHGNDAQGTVSENNNEERNNNEEGIEDETDNQCQLWSSTQPSSLEPPSTSTQNQTTTDNNNTFGDIWSTEAFSYYTSYQSPLKTLLDSNSYTLCELLKQDELLQELRGCEIKLIEYFSKEEVVAELVQTLMVDVPHELPSQLEGEDGMDGKERWIKQEVERRAANKLKQDKEQEKRSYAQALESPENKLPSSHEDGLSFDASSPDQSSNATLDINTPNGSSPTFLPSPNENDAVLGNEELETEEEELSPLGMLFLCLSMS